MRTTIRRWEERGLGGLWEASGRGAKPKFQAEDLQYAEELLVQETRTYNSTQLVTKLKQERGIDLSSDRLWRLLKKKYRWKRTRTSHRKKQNPEFEYALAQGGFNGKSYIKVMDWVAHKAAQTLAETGRLTVVVQDNRPLHKSHLVRQKWAGWQEHRSSNRSL